MKARDLCIAMLCCSAIGCGATNRTTGVETAHDPSESAGSSRGPTEELSVSGLRGTLSQEEIRRALEPRMMKLSRCVERRASTVELISGELELTFHIALDGSVAQVFPSKSSFGDREAERCMVDVAKATRFAAPHGGEADFSWPLEVPLDGSIRAPVAWTAADAGDVVSAASTPCSLLAGGSFSVTAYVDTDGRVLSAGVATSDEGHSDKLDCVADQVKTWVFPSPGSYPAKIRFDL